MQDRGGGGSRSWKAGRRPTVLIIEVTNQNTEPLGSTSARDGRTVTVNGDYWAQNNAGVGGWMNEVREDKTTDGRERKSLV